MKRPRCARTSGYRSFQRRDLLAKNRTAKLPPNSTRQVPISRRTLLRSSWRLLIGAINCGLLIAAVGDSPMTERLRAAQLAPVPQKKIFQDQCPFSANKRCATSTALNLTVNRLWPSIDFDDLIKRAAIRASERDCYDHRRLHSRCGRRLPFLASPDLCGRRRPGVFWSDCHFFCQQAKQCLPLRSLRSTGNNQVTILRQSCSADHLDTAERSKLN